MALRGDFSKLSQLRTRLTAAKSPAARHALNRVLGAAALAELQKGFRSSVDPYGSAWLPLKRRKGKPLLDTARMRNSYSASATATGFRIGTSTAYAPHHQYGTSGRKAASSRSMPTNGRGRFMSHKASSAKKGRKAQGFKRINFQAGGGAIPPRMMLPSAERGLGMWRPPLEAAARRFVSKLLRGR